LNDQRHVIFSQRKDAMDSNKIFEYSDAFIKEISNDLINLKIKKMSNPINNDFENRVKTIIGNSLNSEEISDLLKLNDEEFKKQIFEKFNKTRENRIDQLSEINAKELEKRIFLQTIDLNWKSHIQYLEQLRQVIGLRSYGQRDPLIEYKKEAFELFSNLLNKLKYDYVNILMNLKVIKEAEENKEVKKPQKINPSVIGKKMSRNEPCFCGSGKKYKRCCGAL
jgi:preprotein translocase subunit SecA